MVLTRNSCMSENFRKSKRILRDIKHQQNLRPRVSNPDYREQSPDEIAYYHNILKVNVKNKKTLSHKLRIRTDNTYKEIHRYELRTTPHNDNNSEINRSIDGKSVSVHESEHKSDGKRLDRVSNASGDKNTHVPAPSINDGTTIFEDTTKKTPVFGVNKCKTAFKRRHSNAFTKHSDMDTSQICYDNGRRYPIRLRRRPELYRVTSGFKSGTKPNWHQSMTSPILENCFDQSRHRKLELYSKQSDTDSSDDLMKDEIRFENRKQRSMQRARAELNPINMGSKEQSMDLYNERALARSCLADIEPMAIDKTITFSMIGGNETCIQALKESLILPLVYPEVFEKLSISPPRGLLFYGAPGSGKTLMARALVNECGNCGNRKIAFFMRKGADCLSKWVGESERQLRLLFDQAYRMRPSIIFFDEIDGLAPVRSARQDQIHSSIVSTLLSLIDGLDDRGEIIVIGATNRLDSIDPALRRPGRFDREFLFTLPEENVRKDIIRIHTRNWQHHLTDTLVEELASVTKGYSGADLKGLVIEAGLCALRRRYPQIYKSSKKLQLNLEEIYVKNEDFISALRCVRPSHERSGLPVHCKIPDRILVLIDTQFSSLKERISVLFRESVFIKDGVTPKQLVTNLFRPRLLVTGYDVDSVISGLLHDIHNVNVGIVDSLYLGTNNGLSNEEKLAHLFREATKSPKSIVYLPHIDITFQSLSLSAQNLFLSLVNGTVPNAEFKLNNVLVLTTLSTTVGRSSSSSSWSEIEFDNGLSGSIWRQLGECFRLSSIVLTDPSVDQRLAYFRQLTDQALEPVKLTSGQGPSDDVVQEEVLKEVEIKPHTLTKIELDKLEQEEDNVLRKFRMLLRKLLASLAKEKRFQIFHNPVDEAEVPDYYNIVTNPMDLGTMRQKVDLYNYNTFEELKSDLNLISANALLYNPPKNSYLKDIRRHAYEFNDIADSVFEEHFNPEFAKIIADIHQSRLARKYYEKKKQALSMQSGPILDFLTDLNGSKFEVINGPLLASQMDTYRTFYSTALPRTTNETKAHSDSETVLTRASQKTNNKCKSLSDIFDTGDNINAIEESLESFRSQSTGRRNGEEQGTMELEEVPVIYSVICTTKDPVLDLEKLNSVWRLAAEKSHGSTVFELETVYCQLSAEIAKYRSSLDRSTLPVALASIVGQYLA